jgi:hypothetical protein
MFDQGNSVITAQTITTQDIEWSQTVAGTIVSIEKSVEFINEYIDYICQHSDEFIQ